MNEYYENNSDSYDGGGSLVSSRSQDFSPVASAPNQINAVSTRAHRQMARQADLSAFTDRCHAGLTGIAINHTVALSTLADQASAFSPAAEPACKKLVDTYVGGAINRLGRW